MQAIVDGAAPLPRGFTQNVLILERQNIHGSQQKYSVAWRAFPDPRSSPCNRVWALPVHPYLQDTLQTIRTTGPIPMGRLYFFAQTPTQLWYASWNIVSRNLHFHRIWRRTNHGRSRKAVRLKILGERHKSALMVWCAWILPLENVR